jgi:hypothetical protein
VYIGSLVLVSGIQIIEFSCFHSLGKQSRLQLIN